MESMASPNGVFGKQLYDICETLGCTRKTQHKSGLCEKCREKTCQFCKKTFVWSKDRKQELCALCGRSKCRH
jgi:hypothetical protein